MLERFSANTLRMKIALVTFNIVTRGGSQRQMLSLAQALLRKGHDVAVYAFDFGSVYGYPDLLEGLRVRVLEGGRGDLPKSILPGIFGGLVAKLKRKRIRRGLTERLSGLIDPDTQVVNVHDDETYKVGYFFKRAHPGARVVWTMNDPPISYLSKGNTLLDFLVKVFNFFELIYERRFARAVDVIAVLDRRNAAMAARYYHRPVEVVRSGLDFDKFYGSRAPKESGLPLRVLSFGIGAPHRRFEDVVLAAKILAQEGKKIRVTILSHSGGDYAEKISRLIHDEKLKDVVAFRLSDKGISDEELRRVYRENDVFVFPNDPQTWGLAVFEAMAAGLVAVVSRTAGASEVLSDGENALLVPPRAPHSIAEKLRWCVEYPDECERMRVRGMEFVRTDISWDRYASSMVSIFKR